MNSLANRSILNKLARTLLPHPGTLLVIIALLLGRSALANTINKPAEQAASAPPVFSYQGRLTDASGASLPVGLYKMRFSIYDVPTAGTPIWTELRDGTSGVPVLEGGFFSVLLGEVEPLPDPLPEAPLYLGIAIDDDTEMAPREVLASVPYALNALDSTGASVPVGTVISWWRADDGTPLPSDEWAIADGSVVDDPESPLYGQALPNMIDQFVMGVAPSSIGASGGSNSLDLAHSHTVDSHRHRVDSHAHSIPSHNHSYSGTASGGCCAYDGGYYYAGDDSTRYAALVYDPAGAWYYRHKHTYSGTTASWSGTSGSTAPYTNYQSPGTDSQLSSSTDNRPQYVGLLFLVKIK